MEIKVYRKKKTPVSYLYRSYIMLYLILFYFIWFFYLNKNNTFS